MDFAADGGDEDIRIRITVLLENGQDGIDVPPGCNGKTQMLVMLLEGRNGFLCRNLIGGKGVVDVTDHKVLYRTKPLFKCGQRRLVGLDGLQGMKVSLCMGLPIVDRAGQFHSVMRQCVPQICIGEQVMDGLFHMFVITYVDEDSTFTILLDVLHPSFVGSNEGETDCRCLDEGQSEVLQGGCTDEQAREYVSLLYTY